jgi:hypothetical protein
VDHFSSVVDNNKRFIRQKGFEAALALQAGNGTSLPEDFKDDHE